MTDRIYVDANIFIYYVDGEPSLQAAARQEIGDHLASGAALVTSELTIGECLRGVSPDDDAVRLAFSSILENAAYLSLVPVTRGIIKRAASLGAQFNMKLADAIHVATAELAGCNGFLTNDHRIKTPPPVGIRRFRS